MELNAERQQAAAELKLARVTLARQQQLAKTQAVSQQDLDTAATEMAVKQARIGTIDARSNVIGPRWTPRKPTWNIPVLLLPWRGK